MAFTASFTVQRGKSANPASLVIGAGTSEAQTDTMTLNIDVTNLSKGEALVMLSDLRDQIERGKWPPA